MFVSHAGYRTPEGKPLAALSVRAGSPPLVIRLAPQSSIQGRITNAAGDPIAGIGVNLARVEIHDGRRQTRTAFAKITGQDGVFDFEDLPPGVYAVRAAGQAAGKNYGPVYYPSAVTEDQARLLRAEPGKAITADFQLESHVSYRIRGIVTNMPLRRTVAIRLLRGDDPVGETAPVGPNGTFEVPDVPAGSYTLQAYTPDIVPLDLGEAAVTVEDRDAVAVKVALSEGEDISGHIEFTAREAWKIRRGVRHTVLSAALAGRGERYHRRDEPERQLRAEEPATGKIRDLGSRLAEFLSGRDALGIQG